MREIKFRGYNGLEWLYTEMIRYVSEDDSWQMMNHETDEWDYVSFIGQYTGLKDKNGKEIYEGDILEIYDREGGRPISKAEVYWNNGYWDAKAIGNHSFWSCYSGFIKNKVIGNIYENPELLEVE